MLRQGFFAWIMLVAMAVMGTGGVYGQDFPNKPLRIVNSGIGGSGDFQGRLIAQAISGPLGQPVVVDSRPSGVIPGQVVSQAPPDGYTLLVAANSFLLGPLFNKIPYDPVRDFSPITLTEMSPNAVVVHPSLPVKSVKELIALAKAKPGELNYGATAIGSGGHLSGALFNVMAGINIVYVPYKSTALVTTSLISGETQVQFGGVASASHIKSGRLRALAVTGAQPSTLFPGLPTVAASGLPGYESVGITAIYAPAKTPEAIIKRLNEEIVRVLNTAEVKEKYFNVGMEVASSSPEQLAAMVKVEIAKWGKVIKDSGIKAN